MPNVPRIPLTVVIAARDAGAHIRACVASVAWAAETLVVEGGSSDDTRLIALAEGATVFTHPFSTIGRQRNLAVERASHEWVLVLDAEERCTPELAHEIALQLEHGRSPSTDAFAIARRSVYAGRALRGGRWAPDAPVRLFRRRFRFDERPGADALEVSDAHGRLDAAIVRDVDVAHDAMAERIATAARDWAMREFARGGRASALDAPRRAIAQFCSSYLARGGWRDGADGLGLAWLDATAAALRWAQLWALTRRESSGGSGTRGGTIGGTPAASRSLPR